MSRVAAYLGPRAPMASLLEDGTYPLTRQAIECPDGFGLGWYPDDDEMTPLRLTSRLPPWAEPDLLALARRTHTRCAIAGLRHLRPGERADLTGLQPFRHGPFLFHATGELHRFKESFERPMRESLRDSSHTLLSGTSEGELLFVTWLDALADRVGGDAMADALEQLVERVTKIANQRGVLANMAVLVSDGKSLVTLRTATHGSPPSLYTIVAESPDPVPERGRVVASEPTFSGSWSPLEPNSLTIFT